MRATFRRLATAGAAAAIGALAATPAIAAPNSVPGALSQIIPRPAIDRIAARGAMTDDTPGNDWVAVQVFIERLDGNGWVSVVTGPRRAGNNSAVSDIPLRKCTDGRGYRAKTNVNYRNEIRDTIHSPAGRC